MTLATSHLGELNTLPSEYPGIVSAGLAFDAERLQPLYRLIKGRPGRSYALALAERVGFPKGVIETAKSSISQERLDTAQLLADLEQKETELEQGIARVEEHERELASRSQAQAQEAAELEERSRRLEREAHERAREFLLQARKQLDEALKADREAASQARRELEASLRQHSQALQEGKDRPIAADGGRFEPGDRVWVSSMEREGTVVEMRGKDVVVEMGSIKLQLTTAVLSKRGEPKKQVKEVGIYGGDEPHARHEVDLRGMVAEDARMELIRALDAAVLAGLGELRVIHGKGTGVLREAVNEYARTDKRVKSHRLGAHYEGGSGVTILELG
jgi:DNA mismatch repair protein MutS2